MKQSGPVRLRGEPVWGKKHVMQVNWIFDEYFVRPETWKDVFRPFGIEAIPVLHYKTGCELKSVLQLKVDTIATSELAIPKEHPRSVCPSCGRTRFDPLAIGFFPNFISPQTQPIIRSREFFGSGALASKVIVVSQELFATFKTKKCLGASFIPLKY
jgi:hypothetical protein